MHAYRADRALDGERGVPGGALVLVDGGRITDVRPAGSPAPPDVPVTARRGPGPPSSPPITAPGGHCWSMGGEARGAR